MISLEKVQEILQELSTSTPLPLFFCFIGFCILIIFYIFVWLSQKNVKSTMDFLQKNHIPYTLRCTPLSYEVVPQLDKEIEIKLKEIEKKLSEIEKGVRKE